MRLACLCAGVPACLRRLRNGIVERPVFSYLRKSFFRRPRLQQDFLGFLEARIGFRDRHVETDEFVVAIPFANPEIQPPAGQQVQRRRLFRQQNRIVPRQHDHRRAQAQRCGAGTEPGQEREGGGDLAEAGEVVPHDESAMEARCFDFDVVFDEAAEPLGAVEFPLGAARGGAAEQTEQHGSLPFRLVVTVIGWCHCSQSGFGPCQAPTYGRHERKAGNDDGDRLVS